MNDSEFFRNIVWKQLSVPDLISFCSTNSEYKKICQNPETWRFLLQRDFNYTKPVKNPMKKYFKIILHKYAEKLFLSAKKFVETRDYEDASIFYANALAAKGIGSTVGRLFGNKVASGFFIPYYRLPTRIHSLFWAAGLQNLM